jgi:polyphosphate kinase
MDNDIYFNRELSWLSFNFRVLQESASSSVPLYERIKFLAIFSSNLDDFFRVRVASLRSLLDLNKKKQKKLKFDPAKLLLQIQKTVCVQQEEFGRIFREEIIPLLNENNIVLVNNENVPAEHSVFIDEIFRLKIFPFIQPALIEQDNISLFLKNKSIYLAVQINRVGSDVKRGRKRITLIEIPVEKCSRFIMLPDLNGKKYVMFADDVLRYCLNKVFPGYEIIDSYSVKLTRDAELYIDDEFSGNLSEKIKSSLANRTTGAPCRFLYDNRMPKDFLGYLKKALKIEKDDLYPGGRYHNFNDLFSFPEATIEKGISNPLVYEPMPAQPCSRFDKQKSVFDVVKEKDVFLHYPYYLYDYVTDFLSKAAKDPKVSSIKITLYRAAAKSKIVKALIDAAKNGKSVTVFVEVKARFDEELNFLHAEEMESAGIKVLYSFPGMKVHAKICLIKREEESGTVYYSYIATGNFNENTAKVYSDIGLFTADKKITNELRKVFGYLSQKPGKPEFKELMVAPFNLRESFTQLIKNEIKEAAEGKKAFIILKLNSIEDRKIIKALYKASNAGVKIYIIVRGICCLIPGVKGLSSNIKAVSIVDRYLEHSRIFVFYNGGNEKVFASSADLMSRNLNRRVELCFPVFDVDIKKKLLTIVNMQLKDNVKARIINRRQTNPFRKSTAASLTRSQFDIYEYYRKQE